MYQGILFARKCNSVPAVARIEDAARRRPVDTWWHGVAADFGDVNSLGEGLRIAVRLLVAALLGGVLGYDRQRLGKSAGLRTHMLVALGAAFIVLIPERDGMTSADLSRVIQGLITGIGFIGAGSILKETEQHRIKGLTTAAGLWFSAAVGMAAGLGREVTAIGGAALAFIVLSLLRGVENYLCPHPQPRSANGKPKEQNVPARPNDRRRSEQAIG
jgi:putative Mg2+ transporter-C (MgtC) family protein